MREILPFLAEALHAERNQLRRELQTTLKDLDTIREQASSLREPAENASGGAIEDNLLLEEESFGVQPVRMPRFDEKFLDSVEPLAPAVVRKAMHLIGRLAAGEEGAFRGTKRLKLDRDLYRQRVGADHRLLFRLGANQLNIKGLINRRDLERTIKSLL